LWNENAAPGPVSCTLLCAAARNTLGCGELAVSFLWTLQQTRVRACASWCSQTHDINLASQLATVRSWRAHRRTPRRHSTLRPQWVLGSPKRCGCWARTPRSRLVRGAHRVDSHQLLPLCHVAVFKQCCHVFLWVPFFETTTPSFVDARAGPVLDHAYSGAWPRLPRPPHLPIRPTTAGQGG
jgi:hypothetical protein